MKGVLFLFLTVKLFASYRFEGYFNNDGEDRYFLMTFFVPYNPTIYLDKTTPEKVATCDTWWPKGKKISHEDHVADFIWVENETSLFHLKQLHEARLIYTTTHAASYVTLRHHLEGAGFKQLCHWYFEGGKGHALFVEQTIFDATMRTLSYTPSPSLLSFPSVQAASLPQFFKKAENKGAPSCPSGIDFIYMINLDERPEKYEMTSQELAPFGITPYRFSAVNGWKLKTYDLKHLGIHFLPGTLQESLMGTTYLEDGEKEYQSNELLKEDEHTYFSFGMSKGAIGICLSHLSVLHDALHSGYETIWVMEDDIEVLSNPHSLSSFISHLDRIDPQWDILFTDPDTKDRQGNRVPCRALAARPNLQMKPLSYFTPLFYPIHGEMSRVGMRYGAYSMILRRSAMEKILRHFTTYGIYLPYDMDYWLADDLKMYAVQTDIVSHRCNAPTDNNKPHYAD